MESNAVEVEPARAGQRLDRLLAEALGISRARVRHLLETGRVSLAGRALRLADKSRPAEAGDRFDVSGPLRAEEETPRPRPDLPLAVLAEGPGWLVVDKPAGHGVHPLRPDQDDTVLNAVAARHPGIVGVGEGGLRSGVVHRLDVETTGALAFATDEPHWKRLRGAFSEHRVEKIYLALVHGRFERARRIDLPLVVARHQPARVAVSEDGRPSRERVRPVETFADATLVEVKLETGFLHQIRATLAHEGHPVVGDGLYGGDTRGDTRSGAGGIAAPRPLLHAARLSVDEVRAEAPLPGDFEAVLAALREA